MAQVHSGPLLAERDGLRVIEWAWSADHAATASLLAARGSLRVIECAGCGFAHLDPFPNGEYLSQYYQNDFWTREKPGALAQIEERRDWWNATYGDWLEIVEKYAPGKDLLDVGSGYGFFMDAASRRGWNPWGIELSVKACEYAETALGWMPVCGSWEDWNYQWPLDCISALWLIEHLPDPLRFLRWCRDRLTDGGTLLAVVPSDFTPLQRHLSTSGKVAVPFWWIHYTHLNYFTPVTFANLLGRAGFRVVEQLTTYPMEYFLAGGKDYTANPALGAALHGQVEAQDLSMTRADRIEFYRLMARRGEGREIVMIARKE